METPEWRLLLLKMTVITFKILVNCDKCFIMFLAQTVGVYLAKHKNRYQI